MPEFTGERVIPGLVDPNLFNEHLARYLFAARVAKGLRVVDAGCGTGYGSALLARSASYVLGVDASEDAISYAKENYRLPNLNFETGDCLELHGGPFDMVVAFEVIEHLSAWRKFLGEARRVLNPGGRFLVSTPNRLYYAESRGESGDNPFHVHEFEFEEFQQQLSHFFPHAQIFHQNHIEGVAFSGESGFETKIDPSALAPETSHFFLALCSLEPLPPAQGLVWIPSTANILREREQHIRLLTGEVKMKTEWLDRSKEELDTRNREYEELLAEVRKLNQQIEERNRWALEVRAEADRHAARVDELQNELSTEQAASAKAVAGYQAKVDELEATNKAKTEWALKTERELTQTIERISKDLDSRAKELAECVAHLDRAEKTVVERTHWAQDLDRQLSEARTRLNALRATNWVKAGARLKMVPENK